MKLPYYRSDMSGPDAVRPGIPAPPAGHSRSIGIGILRGKRWRVRIMGWPVGRRPSRQRLHPGKLIRKFHAADCPGNYASGRWHRAGRSRYGKARYRGKFHSAPIGHTTWKWGLMSFVRELPAVLPAGQTSIGAL